MRPVALLLLAALASSARATDCAQELLPRITKEAPLARTVEPLDLARLRDFGKQDVGLGGAAPFSLSPDGRKAALVLRRGDPAKDTYCIGVVVIPLDGASSPYLVDHGGEFILRVSDVRGIPDLPIGNAEPVIPQWSSDGRTLAYLRRDGGRTRVWLAQADGSGSKALLGPALDVRAVRWSSDGSELLVKTRRGLEAGEATIEAEGRSGFLYDARFWTLSRSRPAVPLVPLAEQAVDPRDGRVLARHPLRAEAGDRPPEALNYVRSTAGRRAWTFERNPGVLLGPVGLKVEIGGRLVECRAEACREGVGALWWGPDAELYFVQSATPDNGGRTTLYRWKPAANQDPRRVLSTNDALFGCQPSAHRIVCARETATRPRHLVAIDPETGQVRILYDPNPEFRHLVLGDVARLRWRTPAGIASFGDLVLPPGHRAGARHALIVVQYTSRGFLRGGTGDEFPVQALAARGFAVLSVERTRPVGSGIATSNEQLIAMGAANFAERRQVLESLEAGVRSAIALGAIDPKRVGITGLSDGAATVQFALLNSALFQAAALSSCCDEPSSSMFAAGPGYAHLLIDAGFPPPGTDGGQFWGQYSLAANAARLRTPILMQLTDDEFRFALETFVTLREHHVPTELYVFPDEYHQKWHPSHRLASYARVVDWFDFWLNGRRDLPERPSEAARWRKLAGEIKAPTLATTSFQPTLRHRQGQVSATRFRPTAKAREALR